MSVNSGRSGRLLGFRVGLVDQHTRKCLWLAWRFGLRLEDGCRKGLDTCEFCSCKVYRIRKGTASRSELGTVKLTDFLEVPLIDMPAKSLILSAG